MDDIVLKAMAKWPNVPACTGWLGLDGRGDWYMRDAAAQAAGPFAGQAATRQSKGSQLMHEALISFIGRNYTVSEHGQWYFQNGPQRVYVELSHAPWVIRVDANGRMMTHTGKDVEPIAALLDEAGCAYVETGLGLGLVHSMDMLRFSDWLEAERMEPTLHAKSALAAKFGFCLSPQQETGD